MAISLGIYPIFRHTHLVPASQVVTPHVAMESMDMKKTSLSKCQPKNFLRKAEVEAKQAASEGRDAMILKVPEAPAPEASGTWIGS